MPAMMSRVTMKRRAFRPGADGDGDRKKPRFRTGSTFEPGHRQVVDVAFSSGQVATAAYNRDKRAFFVRVPKPGGGAGWLDAGSESVIWWSQKLPRPRRGER